MIKIFGKNNNQLFRKSQKMTYSMPQSLPFSQSIQKCACGYDYLAVITSAGKLYFVFQAKPYQIQNTPLLSDIATSQNTICMITRDSQILVWDFDQEKIMNNRINFTKIKLNFDNESPIKRVQMGSNDIFLLAQSGKVYHFKRNQWYETKTYSNIQSVQLSHKIIDVSSGQKLNLFLTYQGSIFQSSKENPFNLFPVNTKDRFIKVSSNLYNAAITKKGTIVIWGDCIHGNFKQPTQFSKLTKKFIDVKLSKQNGYALADDGQVWVWGLNQNGQLGVSDYEKRIKPFPLVTLQKQTAIQVFCGDSYACCLCLPYSKNKNHEIKVVDRKVSEFSLIRQNNLFKKNHDYNLAEKQKQLENKQFSSYSPIIKRQKTVEKQKSKHKNLSFEKRFSYDMHQQKKGIQFNQKGIKFEFQRKQDGTRQAHRSSWLASQRQNQLNYNHQDSTQLQIKYLKQENLRLNQKIAEQCEIISDITGKIRLLQEAIDQYERNLTSRDHTLQQYQTKQHQYISHIEQLQRTIDEIVRLKQKNQQILVVYQDMKTNFQKERVFYTDKIRDYQIKMHVQQGRFSEQIENLKKKLQLKEQTNKQNFKPKWQSHSPISKKEDGPYFGVEMLGQKCLNKSMDVVIQQIQTNKNLITKSANKLIALLDMSQ